MTAPDALPDSTISAETAGDATLAMEQALAAAVEDTDVSAEASAEAIASFAVEQDTVAATEQVTVRETTAEAEPKPDMIADVDADLEAALDQSLADDQEFSGLVREAIDKFGGEILFELDHDPQFGHVAAVQMGDGAKRQFAMVIKPENGGPLRVEPAAESEHPLAQIMNSYAGLVEAWKKAA